MLRARSKRRSIDERLVARIREAELAQLGVWIERFATATELDAIFSP
jgi:hypothetical protein